MKLSFKKIKGFPVLCRNCSSSRHNSHIQNTFKNIDNYLVAAIMCVKRTILCKIRSTYDKIK